MATSQPPTIKRQEPRLAACDALGGFLDPCPANDPLRADTDVALEQPMQGTDGDPGDPVCNTLPRAQG